MTKYKIEYEILPINPEPERGKRKVLVRWHVVRDGARISTHLTRKLARAALKQEKIAKE